MTIGGRCLLLLVAFAAAISSTFANDMDPFCRNAANGRFVPNPRSCQHWIFCQNGRATEGVCPDIFYFDVNMQMCRYPMYVDCQFDSVDVTCSLAEFEVHPHPENCDQYVACIDGFPRVLNCAPGLHWDRVLNTCNMPDNAQCTIEVPTEPVPDLNYYCDPDRTYVIRHPHDCQKFILCVAGEKRLNRCADQLLFDPVHLRCDIPENVECQVGDGGGDVAYECDASRGVYRAAHPLDCNQFILCVNGNRQFERCAPGLWFDWIDLQCNVESQAICLAPPS